MYKFEHNFPKMSVAGQRGNGPSGSVKAGNFLDQHKFQENHFRI
jgi:hypothetical protein